MLKDDFFKINSIQHEGDWIKATLELNSLHAIFGGHFPNFPVVPGVCLMQMVKETIEQVINQETRLTKADNMKFLSVINPNENKIIHLEGKVLKREQEQWIIDAKLFNEATIFFKMRGILTKT